VLCILIVYHASVTTAFVIHSHSQASRSYLGHSGHIKTYNNNNYYKKSYLMYRQRSDNHTEYDDEFSSRHHRDDDNTEQDSGIMMTSQPSLSFHTTMTTSPSQPTTTTTTSIPSFPDMVQRLDIEDRLLTDIFDTWEIQQWLYHRLPPKKIQTSHIRWLDPKAHGDILTISPLSLISELLTSLYPNSVNDDEDFLSSLSSTISLPDKVRFRFEHQRCLLKSISQDNTGLADLLQHGQSNTHPLGYSIVAIPPHIKIPLSILPSFQCMTVLTGKLCIQQMSIPNIQWDMDSLCRQLYHCVGTPLSDMSSPPTKEDLHVVAKDLQQRVNDLIATTSTLSQQQQPSSSSTTSVSNNNPNSLSSMMKLHPRHYVSAGSFVGWNTGTILSLSTQEEPCLLLCLSSQLPIIHYKPPPPSQKSDLMRRLFPNSKKP